MTGTVSVPEPAKSKAGQQPRRQSKGMVDGFRTMPEPEPLRVQPENVAPFSLPLEALTYMPPQEAVVYKFKNGDKERKIYCNVEVSDTERDQLQQLQEEVKRRGLTFMPSIAVMATRFLSRARGDTAKAVKLMQATNGWRQEFFKDGPVADAEIMEDMKHGIVYFCGRDSALRPTIVVRAIRIPNQWYKEKRIDRLIRILIFSMEYMLRYMLVPGRIENNCLIVDLKGLSISQVPLSALGEIYKVMSHHYIGRVFKFYICNMSTGLSTIAGMAKSILTDRQKQKLVFLDNVKELQKEFALHHLEEDLGGSRPVLKEFFPFPLQAGPFEGGCATGPDPAAVPNGHEVFTATAARGRLWDARQSRVENLRLECTPEAAQRFFGACGLPVPPGCLQRPEPPRPPAQEQLPNSEAIATAAKLGGDECTLTEGEGKDQPLDEREVSPHHADEAEDFMVVQDTGVKPKGLFSCMPCWCNHKA